MILLCWILMLICDYNKTAFVTRRLIELMSPVSVVTLSDKVILPSGKRDLWPQNQRSYFRLTSD